MYQRESAMGGMPPVVKNLLIINTLVYFISYLSSNGGFNIPGIGQIGNIDYYLGLYTPGSPHFHFYQYFTYMFMHANFTHLFFNMFALFMFGRILENVWGSQRFLFYYLTTGIGAGVLYVLVGYIRMKMIIPEIPSEVYNQILTKGHDILRSNQNYVDPTLGTLNGLINIPIVGASGAIFGLLLAFGMLFPNEMIYLYMVLPLKAKWFVAIYGAIEVVMLISNNPTDNVAHLAHLGGMLFGFLIIKYWKRSL